VGSPEAINALSAAFAPGMGITRTPAAIASATSQLPGSLIPGIPASETMATRPPAFIVSISSVVRWRSLCWWQLTVGVEI